MIRVLIADDHPIVREGLKRILASQPDIRVTGEAENSQEVMKLAQEKKWDMVVLDITMPGRGGLETLKELKSGYPKLPVLILSMHPEDQYAVRALQAGADGYLTKGAVQDELVGALRKILSGGKYVSAALAEKLAVQLRISSGRPAHENLSDREYQVMIAIASGKRLSDIARDLSLSVKTIATYRARVLEKMDLKNNAELTGYAFKNQLIS